MDLGLWCPENMNVVAKEVLRPFARELELGMQRLDFLIRKLGRVGDGVAVVDIHDEIAAFTTRPYLAEITRIILRLHV